MCGFTRMDIAAEQNRRLGHPSRCMNYRRAGNGKIAATMGNPATSAVQNFVNQKAVTVLVIPARIYQ
jgi:hypothetical protein